MLVNIWQQEVLGGIAGSESLWEDIGFGNEGAFLWGPAVDGLDDIGELDPSVFLGGNVGGNGHDQGNQTVLPGTWNGGVVDQGIAKGNGFGNVGLVVSGKEEIVRHVSISGEV